MHRDVFLHDTLKALGVDVTYAHLSNDRDGEYRHDERLIRLRPRMSARLHRSVLAHETAHAIFGDTPTRFGPVHAKRERRADEWAALRLIPFDEYRRAEHAHDGHLGAMAHDLGVVRSILTAYQRILLRVGDTTYLDPRMGEGQWLERVTVAS